MSLSGTVVFCMCLVVCRIFKYKLIEMWKRNLLLIAIPFYLVPIPLFNYGLRDMFIRMFHIGHSVYGPIDKTFLVVFQNGETILSSAEKMFLIIGCATACISLVYISYKAIGYGYFKYLTIKCPKLELSQDETNLFIKLKKDLQMKEKVRLIKTSCAFIPFTTGIWRPSIIISSILELEGDNLQRILSHEMAHIKHKDNWWNLLALVVIALHWYNPFCYIYLYMLQNENGLYSDETTAKAMTKKEKINYCELLIDISGKSNLKRPNFLQLNFTGNAKKQIKGRIDSIMKRKKVNVMLAISISIIAIISGTVTTFAYEGAQEIYIEEGDFSLSDDEEFVEFTSDSVEKLVSDDYFIDDDGNIYPANQTDSKEVCKHSLMNGTRKVHTKIGKGCKIDYYRAKRCTKCGIVFSKVLYNTESWKVCKH